MGRTFIRFLLVSVSMLTMTACLSEDDKFDGLQGGDISDVDSTTITQFLPDAASVTIQQAASQVFSVTAEAPGGRTVTYSWSLDGVAVQSGATTSYTITGSVGNIGSHTLVVVASDGATQDTKSWSVKVNGPPVITPITTGTPLVSVGSTLSVSVSAVDPNSDTLTYTWKLNGASSSYFVATSAGSADFIGHDSIVGSVNLEVTVSDGSASSTHSWVGEVNHFPMQCNQLTNGKICTFAGSPSVGDGLNPAASQQGIKTSITGATVDDLGNYIYADILNHVVWYWNNTASSVTRFGVTIPANSIKVIAGTGEPALGSEGIAATDCALSSPQDVYYHQASSTLYIADRGNNLVRFVNSSGTIYNGLGNGASNVNGVSVYSADCDTPYDLFYYAANNSLYVACYTERIVKRWDLSDDNAYNIMGNGTAGCAGDGGAALAANLTGPIGTYVNAQGVYIADYGCHNVRFYNHSGGAIDFYGATAPASINSGLVTTVMGSGVANYDDTELDPLTIRVGQPRGVYVNNNLIYVISDWSNRDRIVVANNSGSGQVISGTTVANAKARRVSSSVTEGYNGSGIDLNTARLYNPHSIFEDPADSSKILVGDYNNLRLRSIDTSDWKISDSIGSGKARYGFVGDVEKPSTEQYFNTPTSVVYDSTNRIMFIVDRANGRIRAEDAFGRIATAVGRGAGTPVTDSEIPSNVLTQFNGVDNPQMALFADGSLAYMDRYIVRMWNRLLSATTYFDTYIQSDSVSTVVGYSGLTTVGNSTPDTTAAATIMDLPDGIAAYGSGSSRMLFYSDSNNHCIKSVDDSGNVETIVGRMDGSDDCLDTPGNGANISSSPLDYALDNPSAIAVDANGNMYIADRDNHKIRFFNRGASAVTIGSVTINAGQIATIACVSGATGSAAEGVAATSARCNSPRGIAVNTNYVCFSNTGYHNVRCINLVGANAGKVYTVAGSDVGTARAGSPFGYEQEGIDGTSASLNSPRGVGFDSNGDLYIADTGNHIIRKVKLQNPPP